MNIKKDYFLGGGLLLLFALLTWSVVMQVAWVGELDCSVQGIIRYDTQMDTRIFEVVALLGSPPVAISLTAAVCGYLWVKGRRYDSIWIGAYQLLESGLFLLIKLLVQRPRPIHQLVADTGFSSPSGHVMCSMVLMLSLLMLILLKIKEQENQFMAILLSIIWIGMVATSRICLRAYFASDILGSLLLANGLWFVILPQARYIDALIVKQATQRSAFRPQRRISSMQKLTIVIPAYNEQEVLKDTVSKLWSIEREVVTQNFLSEDSDILIVDDGSSDNTWSIIESSHKQHSKIRGLRFLRNFGHQAGLIAGLTEAIKTTNMTITIDADLQDDPEKIMEMVQAYSAGADLSMVCATIVKLIAGLNVRQHKAITNFSDY